MFKLSAGNRFKERDLFTKTKNKISFKMLNCIDWPTNGKHRTREFIKTSFTRASSMLCIFHFFNEYDSCVFIPFSLLFFQSYSLFCVESRPMRAAVDFWCSIIYLPILFRYFVFFFAFIWFSCGLLLSIFFVEFRAQAQPR